MVTNYLFIFTFYDFKFSVITYLILLQFWLPTNSKDKIVLNCFTAAVINIFLLYFNHRLIASGSTPLIGKLSNYFAIKKEINGRFIVLFYSSSLYIVGITTITAIINYSLCKIRNYHPFAWFTNFLLKDWVSKWFALENYSKLVSYKIKYYSDNLTIRNFFILDPRL